LNVLPPHVARQNIELSPIFRDGAARDRNAAVAHILDEHVSLRTRHSSINLAEITLARRTGLFFFDVLPSVEMKFTKQQFSALGPIRDYCLKSNAKMKTTSGFSE
jgi:hypothetical protein